MGVIIPESITNTATAGEKRLFSLFKNYLPDDCVVYYEPMIDSRKPDYVLIIPDLGVLVLEVKDYKMSSIKEANSNEWILSPSGGKLEKVKNPITQARDYSFLVINKLKKEPRLHSFVEGVGRLKVAYGYGTVFTKISRVEFLTSGLDDLIPDNLVLCEEDIVMEPENRENLFERLSSMFTVRFKRDKLNEEEINAIRYNLFPEIRIGYSKTHDENNLVKLNSLSAMTIYQEIISKQLGSGHRLLRGVAGSGKTLILAARAKLLSMQNPEWKILIVCYGVILSRSIKELIDLGGDYPNIEVMTFNEFLYHKFRMYDDSLLKSFVDLAEKGFESLPRYDAILVDEAQDFDGVWLKLLSMCINPETGSILFAEDKAQDIFKKKVSYLQQTGLDFRGRSKVLSINYRNTINVLEVAWKFYKTFIKEDKSNSLEIIEPKSARRKGTDPTFNKFNNFTLEAEWIANKISKMDKSTLGKVAILYRVKKFGKTDYLNILMSMLKSYGVDYEWSSKDRKSKSSFGGKDNKVKLLTLDSSKGLDFETVFVINIDNLPLALVKDDIEREASLMYIGLTRSTGALHLSASAYSVFADYFERELKSDT